MQQVGQGQGSQVVTPNTPLIKKKETTYILRSSKCSLISNVILSTMVAFTLGRVMGNVQVFSLMRRNGENLRGNIDSAALGSVLTLLIVLVMQCTFLYFSIQPKDKVAILSNSSSPDTSATDSLGEKPSESESLDELEAIGKI
jgi:hypothetical protein